ncbi:MAG TPA: hypothetical protein VK961_17835 [Chthoniobacter sp.]|nr:hypothetical protein [Chthoniobacter sp.]
MTRTTILTLAIVASFWNLHAADAPQRLDETPGHFAATLVAFRQTSSAADLTDQLLNTRWSWIHPGAHITFRENGQAWVNTDREVKNWFVADAAHRIVAGTFAGSRTIMFTFSPDFKTARAVLDGERPWDAKRLK